MRNQLHRYNKCFTGREFVATVLEVGRAFVVGPEPSSASSTPVPLSGAAGVTPGGRPVEYTAEYAIELGQFLLRESILIKLPRNSGSLLRSGANFTPVPLTDDEGGSLGGELTESLSSQSHTSITSQRSCQIPREQSLANTRSQRTNSITFFNDKYSFYKFAESEDEESNSLYQSHILSSSTVQGNSRLTSGLSRRHSTASSLQEEHREFTRARQATLFLVHDLLLQRKRKERRIKQFLLTPRALEVVELRRRNTVNCELIFKM